jgi:predicted RNase H-like nuclease (RuvC/YqgF family)
MSKTHVIDGVTYVEVDRDAKVGDKVLIVKAEDTYGKYMNGSIITVDRLCSGGIESDIARSDEGEGNSTGFIIEKEYVVIEPNNECSEDSPKVTDLLANLARRVEYLERKATSLEQQLRDTQGNCEKLAEELATVKHQTQPQSVEVVTFEKFLDSIADKVAGRLVGGGRI